MLYDSVENKVNADNILRALRLLDTASWTKGDRRATVLLQFDDSVGFHVYYNKFKEIEFENFI